MAKLTLKHATNFDFTSAAHVLTSIAKLCALSPSLRNTFPEEDVAQLCKAFQEVPERGLLPSVVLALGEFFGRTSNDQLKEDVSKSIARLSAICLEDEAALKAPDVECIVWGWQ